MEIELIGTLYSDTVSISVEKVTNCGANDCPMVDEPHIIFRVITLITIKGSVFQQADTQHFTSREARILSEILTEAAQ